MITQRQEKILNFLVKEYICSSEPISSKALKQATGLDVCGATIRNDLQELTKQGFIEQPHTSAGRVPTRKAYKYFADKMAEQQEKEMADFIVRQIKEAHRQLEQEIILTQELMQSLAEASSTFSIPSSFQEDDLFEILLRLGPSRNVFERNREVIIKIIKELENF